MEKIDRLGWAAGFSFSSYGVRVGVRTSQKQSLLALLPHFPPSWKPLLSPKVSRLFSWVVGGKGKRPGTRRFHVLYEGGLRVCRTMDPEELLEIFASRLRLCIAEEARTHLFVHAGVVGWKGKAILLPGRSFSGKTTLVTELIQKGAKYYSDEYALLHKNGKIYPFAKPLSIREGDSPKQTNYSAKYFGAHSGKKPLPVGLVLLSQYRKNARFGPKPLSKGQGVLALLSNTVAARQKPKQALAILEKAIGNAQVFKSVRNEAKDVVSWILQQIEIQKKRE